jgi:hypothetical protein
MKDESYSGENANGRVLQMVPLINFVAGPALSSMSQKQSNGTSPNHGNIGCKHVNTGNTALFISGKLLGSFTWSLAIM